MNYLGMGDTPLCTVMKSITLKPIITKPPTLAKKSQSPEGSTGSANSQFLENIFSRQEILG
jgi:hypothetical protein